MSTRILGAVCLHYGKEYFAAALESIMDHVDEIVVFYSATPSHGSLTKLTCPDTRDELKGIADQFGCTWQDLSGIIAEHQHRRQYELYAQRNGYDQILIIDSDEVHDPDQVLDLLAAAREQPVKRIGVAGSRWVTPYRSFNEIVTDGFAPIRVINVKQPEGEAVVEKGFIYHMGYAIPNALMEYKISCHGHKADFERNTTWYKDKWLHYHSGVEYLHPATEAYWIRSEPFDKTTMPEVLKKHPNYNLDRI